MKRYTLKTSIMSEFSMYNSRLPSNKRTKALCNKIIKEVPRFPNNLESKKALQNKCLGEKIAIFLTWKRRFVSPRKRKVSFNNEEDIRTSALWEQSFLGISNLLKIVKEGGDLTPHLSLQIKKNGFMLREQYTDILEKDGWCDKDFILAHAGLHHFHIGKGYKDGHNDRTNNLLLAEITKKEFIIYGVYSHAIFPFQGTLSIEEKEFWSNWRQNRSLSDQIQTYISGNYHADIYFYALKCLRTIVDYEIDCCDLDKLEDRIKIFHDLSINAVKKQKLVWDFDDDLNFGLLDKTSNIFSIRTYFFTQKEWEEFQQK